jgi:hypothetical protein
LRPGTWTAEEGSMEPKIKLSAAVGLFIALLMAEYSALAYFGNPTVQVIYFISAMELVVFMILLAHVCVMMIRGLRVGEDYFILPHPGIYAIKDWGPRRILFNDIKIAYYHQSLTSGGSQLRIKLSDGTDIALRQGDLGIKPGSFDMLINKIDILHKLDTNHFRS